jgi:hypothetical protein
MKVVQAVKAAQGVKEVRANREAMAEVTKNVQLCIALVVQADLEEPVAQVARAATVETVATVGQ